MPRVKCVTEVDVEIEVWCSCGTGLCRQSVGGDGSITVEPCKDCLQNKYDEGFEDGYTTGTEDKTNDEKN